MKKIQWNKITWYSRAIAFALFIVLPFAGFYLGIMCGKILGSITILPAIYVTPDSANGTALAPYYSDTSSWQTDSNTAGNFSIAYPLGFASQDMFSSATNNSWRVNATEPGSEFFSLVVPASFEPQTNLADVTLTVGASKNATAVKECLTPMNGETVAGTPTTIINGITFGVFTLGDAGAGNLYDTTSYRTVHNGECYAIEYTIHSSQIANYPSSYNLHQFDQTPIDTLMKNIIGTFSFNN